MKHLPDLLGEYPLSAHSFPKPRVIQLAAPNGSDPVQHLSLLTRLVAIQPVLEYGGNSERQAQYLHPCPSCASLPGLFHHRRYLVVGQPRDYRGDQSPPAATALPPPLPTLRHPPRPLPPPPVSRGRSAPGLSGRSAPPRVFRPSPVLPQRQAGAARRTPWAPSVGPDRNSVN